MTELLPWIGFTLFILCLLALDLGLFHRKAHAVSVKEAGIWCAVWTTLAILFGSGMYFVKGPHPSLEFFTGYLIELALSVDNIFVFVVVLSYFRVPKELQHRVLFWGILGALILRAAMIIAGTMLIQRFHWVIYIFGAFLVYTGIKMAFHSDENIDPEANPFIKLIQRFLPVTNRFHEDQFFVHSSTIAEEFPDDEKSDLAKFAWVATPLFVVLVVIETTDVVFALDSIPAIFGVTLDPFIVYTSNIFAILGLRSMYFFLAGIIDKFHLLKIGLSFVLFFIGVKMLISGFVHIPIAVSLAVVGLVITGSVVASLTFPKTSKEEIHLPESHRVMADGESALEITTPDSAAHPRHAK
ncbi:MAG: TerC family protein [Acidobacteria bacterium]|nr:TerC family protein [Acidobacteriota bacterium]